MPNTLTRLSLSALALLATFSVAVPAHAQSWAESWFDNVTYTSPGSFEHGRLSARQRYRPQ